MRSSRKTAIALTVVAVLIALVSLTGCDKNNSTTLYNYIRHIGNTYGDGVSLNTFIAYGQNENTSNNRDIYGDLDWRTDTCSGPIGDYLDDNWGSHGWRACVRHDFNWANWWQLQHYNDPPFSAWNQDILNRSNNRILEDFVKLCNDNVPIWIPAFRTACIANAYAAWAVLNTFHADNRNPHVGPYNEHDGW